MIFTTNKKNLFLALATLVVTSMMFVSCNKEDITVKQEKEVTEISQKAVLADYLDESTQWIDAKDLGEGTYQVTGKQGTIIEINNALVDAAGNRVTGDIQIQLIEIYTPLDMIMNRKQTLTEVNGQPAILESGGEVFVEAFQNGEKLTVDGRGDMRILFPTENTGGAKENMEVFLGEEQGYQIMWRPTGQAAEVVTLTGRVDLSFYVAQVQNTLGWINIDKIYEPLGEEVECINVHIECEGCEITPANSFVAIYVPNVNSAFEIAHAGGNSFKICSSEEGTLSLGGVQVSFVVLIECDGVLFSAIVTTTINPGWHDEVIDCEMLQETNEEEFQFQLETLTRC